MNTYEVMKIRSEQIKSGRHRDKWDDFIDSTPVPCGCCVDILPAIKRKRQDTRNHVGLNTDTKTLIGPPMIYTVAHFNWEGDGITALYNNDNLVMDGDYYHDKIDSLIEGYFLCLIYMDVKFEREDVYVSGKDFPEGECHAPETLSELKCTYPWTSEPE
jgi:hypothetical protein